MDAAGQHQHAGEVAERVFCIDPAIQRPAGTLERKTFRIGFVLAGIDLGRPGGGIDPAAAQDAAEAGRDIEVGLAPAMDDDGELASGLAVEDRNQPLVGIELNGAFGGDPVRAVLPA